MTSHASLHIFLKFKKQFKFRSILLNVCKSWGQVSLFSAAQNLTYGLLLGVWTCLWKFTKAEFSKTFTFMDYNTNCMHIQRLCTLALERILKSWHWNQVLALQWASGCYASSQGLFVFLFSDQDHEDSLLPWLCFFMHSIFPPCHTFHLSSIQRVPYHSWR